MKNVELVLTFSVVLKEKKGMNMKDLYSFVSNMKVFY